MKRPASKKDLKKMTTQEKIEWLQSDEVRQKLVDEFDQPIRRHDELMQKASEALSSEEKPQEAVDDLNRAATLEATRKEQEDLNG